MAATAVLDIDPTQIKSGAKFQIGDAFYTVTAVRKDGFAVERQTLTLEGGLQAEVLLIGFGAYFDGPDVQKVSVTVVPPPVPHAPLITCGGKPFVGTHPEIYEFLVRLGVRGNTYMSSITNTKSFLDSVKKIAPSPHIYETADGVYYIKRIGVKVCIYSLKWRPEVCDGGLIINYAADYCTTFMREMDRVFEPLKAITCCRADIDDRVATILTWIGIADLDKVSLYNACKTMQYHINNPSANQITIEGGRQIYRNVLTETFFDRRHYVHTNDIYYLDGKVVCSKKHVTTDFESA